MSPIISMTKMDLFPALLIIIIIILFIQDFKTNGKYRTRSLALITSVIGLILGIIYVLVGS